MIGFLSDFGDENMLWPLIFLITMVLAWQRRARMAVWWLGCVGMTFGVLVFFKLWFEACGRMPGSLVYSPSGHTAGAGFVYGAMVLLFTRRLQVGLAAAVIVESAIGLSRVLVHAHNPAEVLVGAGIGFLGILALAMGRQRELVRQAYVRHMREHHAGKTVWSVLVLGLGALTLMLHGLRSPAEHWVESWSHRFAPALVRCPAVHQGVD